MQKFIFYNVLRQAINPKKFPVMIKKVVKRFLDSGGDLSIEENLKWLESQRSDFKELAISLDAALWSEAERASKSIGEKAAKILGNIEYNLGGGGAYPFLYWIARYMEPDCIVETGVSAGYSSYSFLLAIKDNGKGRLYSSDFPLFRIPNPENYIGIVVEQSLKKDWILYLDGDEANLPKIANIVDKVDIFHYDSDKSYSGRKFAIRIIEKLMDRNGIIVIDDIQNNSYFYDYVKEKRPRAWHVFKFEGKYVGMVGELTNRCA